MHAHRLTACLGLVAVVIGAFAQGAEAERNGWPVVVRQHEASAGSTQWTGAGPLLFGRPGADGGRTGGVRPFWIQQTDAGGALRLGHFLYPLFNYRADENTYSWNFLELVRRTDRRANDSAKSEQVKPGGEFEVWPFWFSRQTGDPELSYRALFPVAGTIKNKLGFERAAWLAFPLYAQTGERGAVTTSVPWPIVRITQGAAHGFGIWPLFETCERPGAWRRRYFLWPLGYDNTTYPAAGAPRGTEPTRDVGALPFYARRTAPGYIDESYAWPLFGYTDRTQPERYHETRYFWPFLVQGRGDNRYVDRWGPFYTHSVINGYDKTWYAWPLLRHTEGTDRGVARTKTQLLYFLYWSEAQRSAAHPQAPAATLTHVWPLFSTWDNGAGRRQFQLFSPLAVFFPGNERVRTAWSPLFAIARHEQTSPGTTRTSLLWNAVTWRRNDAGREREFHLGPLFSVSSDPARKRIAIGNGLLAFRRSPGAGWKLLWLDFPSPSATGVTQPH